MLLTRNWLNKYLNLNQITNQEISQALNSLGFEVDHEINYEALNKKVVIGYVQEHHLIEGTHLSVNQVQIAKNKVRQIVCGASNVNQGQFVLVAPIGAEIANGLTMAKRKLQGYESNGMILALNEIGFTNSQLTTDEQDEIYVIKNYPVKKLETLIGHSINVLGFNDYSWEVDLTLNRSDALSALQLAKELANYFNLKFKTDIKLKKPATLSLKPGLSLKVGKPLANLVNSAAISSFALTNAKFDLMTTDDIWLKISEAKSTGIPIYDLANKVGLETGQPVILLDEAKIDKLELTIQTVGDKELVVLKQDQEVVNIIGQLPEPEFMVTDQSQKVLVVYLNLDQPIMRKQQQLLNLSNIALQRYMKPIYPNKANLANKSLEKILTNYGILKAISGEKYFVGPKKTNNQIKTKLSYINNFLGTNLTSKEVMNLFKYLDFKVSAKGDELTFVVDPNRSDLENPIDLTEEVARLYGYDNIDPIPLTVVANDSEVDLKVQLENKVTDYLIGQGLNNIKTYSLIGEADNLLWNFWNFKHPVKLLAPLSANHQQYRLSLASSMLEAISSNLAKGNKQLRFFEIGEVYFEKTKHQTHLMLGINGDYDYYLLKSYVDAILNFYNIDLTSVEFNVDHNVDDQIHPYINAKIIVNKKVLGFIYKLNPAYENSLKIGPTFLAELDLNTVMEVANLNIVSQEFSKFQASTRDLSFEINDKLTYQEVINKLIVKVKNLVNYEIIDIYSDQELKARNAVAIAVSFTFNNLEEQMSELEINESWDQVLKNAKELRLKVR